MITFEMEEESTTTETLLIGRDEYARLIILAEHRHLMLNALEIGVPAEHILKIFIGDI